MGLVTGLWGRNIPWHVVPSCGELCPHAQLEPSLQALLTKIWWGAMTTDTAISKLVVSFFCPPLIWTNLIKFRWSIWHCYLPRDSRVSTEGNRVHIKFLPPTRTVPAQNVVLPIRGAMKHWAVLIDRGLVAFFFVLFSNLFMQTTFSSYMWSYL